MAEIIAASYRFTEHVHIAHWLKDGPHCKFCGRPMLRLLFDFPGKVLPFTTRRLS